MCERLELIYRKNTMQNTLRKSVWLLPILLLALVFPACSSDDDVTGSEVSEDYVSKAKDVLTGDIVLSTRATMNGVDKTLLESGCPTKFSFTWNEDGTMTTSLVDFTVGTMPFAVTFKCRCKFMNLNSWEKDEYTETGWIKFQGTNGNVTTIGDEASDSQQGSGATIDGYLNVATNKIEFIINYNMMNVRTETFKQTIDKSRIDNFEAEFAQYEKDLAQWKKEHGEG